MSMARERRKRLNPRAPLSTDSDDNHMTRVNSPGLGLLVDLRCDLCRPRVTPGWPAVAAVPPRCRCGALPVSSAAARSRGPPAGRQRAAASPHRPLPVRPSPLAPLCRQSAGEGEWRRRAGTVLRVFGEGDCSAGDTAWPGTVTVCEGWL